MHWILNVWSILAKKYLLHSTTYRRTGHSSGQTSTISAMSASIPTFLLRIARRQFSGSPPSSDLTRDDPWRVGPVILKTGFMIGLQNRDSFCSGSSTNIILRLGRRWILLCYNHVKSHKFWNYLIPKLFNPVSNLRIFPIANQHHHWLQLHLPHPHHQDQW